MSMNAGVRRGSNHPRHSPNNRMHHANSQSRSVMNNSKTKESPFLIDGIYKESRFTWWLASLVGCTVNIKTENGKLYEGIFETFSPDLELVLQSAHLVLGSKPSIPSQDDIIDKLVIGFDHVLHLSAINADTKFAEVDAFTDSAISRSQNNGSTRESELKELTPWEGGDETDVHLEDGHKSSGWKPEDMFRHNEEKFGVKSSYDDSMHLYTTPLEKRNTAEYLKKEREAERIAAEIEQNTSSWRNSELENGDEIDEESAFSAVVRPTTTSPSHRSVKSNDGHLNTSKKHTPPQLSSQRRMINRENSIDKQKPVGQSKHIENLKKFGENFKLSSSGNTNTVPSSQNADIQKHVPNELGKVPPSPGREAKPTQPQHPKQVTAASPPVSTTAPAVASSKPVEAAVSEAVANQVAKSPMTTTSAVATTAISATITTTTVTATTDTPATSNSVDMVVKSSLNPRAKDFVPKAAKVPVSPSQPLTHAAPQTFKPKTATVSVSVAVEMAQRQMPTAAQASGPPIFNSNTPTHHQQYVIQPTYPQSGRGQMVPVAPHYINQASLAQYGQMAGAPPVSNHQSLSTMPPPTPPSTSHHQQPMHQPPAPVMTPTTQHFHHHQNHQGPSQHFAVYQPPVSGPQAQQPPLQPSPHNPTAASPVMTSASMPPNSFINPVPQQFTQQHQPQHIYPAQTINGSIAQSNGQTAPPVMYYPVQSIQAGQYHHPQFQGYYAYPPQMQGSFPPHYPPQQ